MKTQALVALLSVVAVRGFEITTPSKHGTLKASESEHFGGGSIFDYDSKCKSLYGDLSWASYNTVKILSSNNAKLKVDGLYNSYKRESSNEAGTYHSFSSNQTAKGESSFKCDITCDTVGDGGDCDWEFYFSYGCKKSDCCYLSHDNSVPHLEKYIFCDNPADEKNAVGSKTSDGIEVLKCAVVDPDYGYNWALSYRGKIKRTTAPFDPKCPSKDSCEYRCAESYELKAVAANMVYGTSTIHDCACDDFFIKVYNNDRPMFGKVGKDMNKIYMIRPDFTKIEIHTWSGDTECPTVYKFTSSSSQILYSMISLLLSTIMIFLSI